MSAEAAAVVKPSRQSRLHCFAASEQAVDVVGGDLLGDVTL